MGGNQLIAGKVVLGRKTLKTSQILEKAIWNTQAHLEPQPSGTPDDQNTEDGCHRFDG